MAAGHPEYSSDSVAGLVLGITEDRHVSSIPDYPSWRNRPAPVDLRREQLGGVLDLSIEELAERLRVAHDPLVVQLRARDADRLE
jgi:hypothetical protein